MGYNYAFTTTDGIYANRTDNSNRTTSAVAGKGNWNKVEITFNSGNLTTLALVLTLSGTQSDPTTCKRWIDDISLVEHKASANDYLNNYKNWQMFYANGEKEIPGYDSDGDGTNIENITNIHDKNNESLTIKADNTYGRTDNSSILISGYYNYSYIMLPDIKANKSYTLTFYYSGEAKKSGVEWLINALHLFAPTAPNATINYNTNGSLYAVGYNYAFTTPDGIYANKTSNSNRTTSAVAGKGNWNKVEITFNSGNLTTLALVLTLNGTESDPTTCKRWIDDITLVEHNQNNAPSLWTVYDSNSPTIGGSDSKYATWVGKEYNTTDTDNIYPGQDGSMHFSTATYQKPATTFEVEKNADYVLSFKYKSPNTPVTASSKTYHITNIAVLPVGGSATVSTSSDRGDVISAKAYNFGFVNQAAGNDYNYITAIDPEKANDWHELTLEFNSGDNRQLTFFMAIGVADIYITDFAVTKIGGGSSEPEQPEIPEGAIFYENFENVTDPTTIIKDAKNQSWANPKLCTTDSVSGNNSISIFGMWQNELIALDTSIFTDDTIYEFSFNWKLKAYTTEKQRTLASVQLVGWNPSEVEEFKGNYTSLSGSFTAIKATGNWESASMRFKWSSDFEEYEQVALRIYYDTSSPHSEEEDTIYIDDLLITAAENQEFIPIDLNEAPRTDDTIKILAFGNSFSNDGTTFIDDIAKADGKDIRVADCSIGGCSLERHYGNIFNGTADYDLNYRTITGTKGIANVSMQQALAAADWDYITIQQVSGLSGQPETFEPYLNDLIAYFKEMCPDAEILFHATWAYAQNSKHEDFSKYNKSQSEMHEAIEDAYLEASQNYGFVKLIPTGEAIRRIRATSMGDNFNRDGYHLNDKGRLVAALTWYETFTGISALDAKVDLTTLIGTVGDTNDVLIGVTEEESLLMRTAAHEAASLFKNANEAQLAIEKIGTITDDSYETIVELDTLREAVGDDLLPNLDKLLAAIDEYKALCIGDVVNDGALNLKDLVSLAQYAADWQDLQVDKYALDINGDASVDLIDVSHYAQYLAGWNVSLGK